MRDTLRQRVISAGGAAAVAALLALLLRLSALARHPFDGLYGQDPYFYLARAKLLGDILLDPAKIGAMLAGGGASFGTWPLGYMAQVAAFFPLFGVGPGAAQWLNIILGSLTCAWVALLAGRLLQERFNGAALFGGAFVAGAAFAVGAVHLRGSLMIMSDVAGLHWAALGVLLAVIALERRGAAAWWLALAAGLLLGLASVTRYQYPLLLLPLALGWLLWRKPDRPAVARLLLLLAGAGLLIGLQQLYNLTHPLQLITSPVLETWSPANFFGTTFNSPDGVLTYDRSMAVYFFIFPFAQWQLLGPGLALAALVGAVALLLARQWRWVALIGGWWLLYALFFSGNVYQADRFILTYLPPLAIGAGYGVAAAWRWLATREKRRMAVAGVLLLVVVGNLLFNARGSATLIAQAQAIKDSDLQTVAAVQKYEAGGANVPVISFGLTATLTYYTDLPVTELWFLQSSTIEALLSGQPRQGVRALLIVPGGDFASRWAGMPMYNTYAWLTAHYILHALGPAGGYELYEIRDNSAVDTVDMR